MRTVLFKNTLWLLLQKQRTPSAKSAIHTDAQGKIRLNYNNNL